jgi:hypothetical protein
MIIEEVISYTFSEGRRKFFTGGVLKILILSDSLGLLDSL